jgi:hypothetical protein
MKFDYDLFKSANNKFIIGSSITDEELKILWKFYYELQERLHLLGPNFYFAWQETLERFNTLDGYKEARKRK